MAGRVCLPPTVVESFSTAFKNGNLKPAELQQMTSVERREFLSGIVGEAQAKHINMEFEKKLLLKNVDAGIDNWIKTVTGMDAAEKAKTAAKMKAEARRKQDRLFNPGEGQPFLAELVGDMLSRKHKVDVTEAEAAQIIQLNQRTEAARAKMNDDGTFPSEADRMEYGYAQVDSGAYLSDLKNAAKHMSLKEMAKKDPGQALSKGAGLAKSVKASFDNSALLRQGWKTLWTNPGAWKKNAVQSFRDIKAQGIDGKEVMREVNADILSRPNADKYHKMGLALSKVEDEFPVSIHHKIKFLGIGRGFRTSEAAYTAFLYRQRADVADQYLALAEKSGVDINDPEQIKKIGSLINSLTGRADLVNFEKSADVLNNVFFSVRFLKSNFDTLTAHQLHKGTRYSDSDAASKFVRKQAAQNLVRIVAGTAATLALAQEMLGDDAVEWDPRSSDFGKIKVGNTRFDVTGGMGSLIVLSARVAKGESKKSSGIIEKLGVGYGSKNPMDVIWDFTENKASPVTAVVRDLIRREDFKGNTPTLAGSADKLHTDGIIGGLTVPIPATTYIDTAKDPNGANAILTLIADGLGIGSNTYGATERKTDNLGKTQQQFKDKVGEQKFLKANEDFGRRYDRWFASKRSEFDKLPNDEKQATITAAKKRIQENIYKEYDFKPKRSASDEAKKRKSALLVGAE